MAGCILLLACVLGCAPGGRRLPEGSPIRVGPLFGSDSFQILTEPEFRWDSLGFPYPLVRNGSRFQGKPPLRHFRDNRARTSFAPVLDGRLDSTGRYHGTGWLPTPTLCSMDSTGGLEIEMSLWLWGGFQLKFHVSKEGRATGTYDEQDDRQCIFKKRLTDTTMTDSVSVDLARIDLSLQERPEFRIGQTLTGNVDFGSREWYRTADYQPGLAKEGLYVDSVMDTLAISGQSRFRCIVGPEIR